jgi:hypothetical protein
MEPEGLTAQFNNASLLPMGQMAPAGEAFATEPQPTRRPGGSRMGRLMRRSRTRTAGIRFEWAMRTSGPVLRVVATWKDRLGQPHHTSYSVQCNGLEGALDRAIASRVSCGAPMPDREDLLQRLQQEFATAPQLAAAAAVSAVAVGSVVKPLPATQSQ